MQARPTSWLTRHPLPWLTLLALVVLGLGLGFRHPWPADEPRFALIAQEMLTTHHWLLPHRAGELYPDKPPVFMWSIALGLWVLKAFSVPGAERIAFLLPSLLGGVGTLALMTDLARRFYGPRIAWLAGLTLLSTVLFTLQAKTAQIDMWVTFFVTVGLYGLIRHILLGPDSRWWHLGFFAMGVGILTKGVGFLPLLMLPVWMIFLKTGSGHRTLTPLSLKLLGTGLLALLAPLLMWGIPMILYTSLGHAEPGLAAYRDNILFKQTGQRYADSWHHLEPWYYYLVSVLPWAWLPLTLALPWTVPNAWRRLKRRDPRQWLPLGFVILMVIFFSLSPGKRGVYMTPATAMFVLAFAPALPALLRRPRLNQLVWGLVLVPGLLIGLIGIAGLSGLPVMARLEAEHGFAPWGWWTALGLLSVLIAHLIPSRRGLVAFGLWSVMFWGLWSTWGYKVMDPARSTQALMKQVVSMTSPDTTLALPDFDESMVLQARQPVVQFGYDTPEPDQLLALVAWLDQAPETRAALMNEKALDHLECPAPVTATRVPIADRHQWWLVRAVDVAGCRADATAAPVLTAPTTLPPTGDKATPPGPPATDEADTTPN
ncbi:ArnT family glycosyltransferase [Larsenimonas rhizosphaerae]|uniref:Glycosyltransferase family 39 protein n=1 Tax=Larsenimonas rhizosphaerae TaxID=2944682 RepID=A0AA41ZFD7_9GAMM|nr:glycosyltransferase family 39 protein [Larsenimonas rhizosphaerae]MCX2524229.1 glycosyltransferase family 39 protein [Larsenimonas rhizosphaerae]